MTQEEQDIITGQAAVIDKIIKRVKDVETAFGSAGYGDGMGNIKSLAKRAAEIIERHLSEDEARLILTRIHSEAVGQLQSMPFPAPPPISKPLASLEEMREGMAGIGPRVATEFDGAPDEGEKCQ